MKIRALLLLVVMLILVITPAWGADITGKWVANVPEPNGKTRKVVFDFRVEGTELRGTVSGAASQIREGKVNGDETSFIVVVNRDGMKIGLSYRGKVSGNVIKFTRARSANGKEVVEFIARRAI